MDSKKKILVSILAILSLFFFSGCSLNNKNKSKKDPMAGATFIKSEDGGEIWKMKMKINDKKTIAGIDVLSMSIKPDDANVIYIGTESDGIFVTKNAGESWEQIKGSNTIKKIYSLAFDAQNTNIIYASGMSNGRGKIYKRSREDLEWEEIYTEPNPGTTISCIGIDQTNPLTLYMGTSEGVINKSTDGGKFWKGLKTAKGPIIGIAFDAGNANHIIFGVHQRMLLETEDGGKTIEESVSKNDSLKKIPDVYAVIADPRVSGVFYAGTGKGIFKRAQDGKWSELNIIASSKEFPIRSIAINPQNSGEIMYASAKAIYKSVDGGVTWSTFQLDSTRGVDEIHYDWSNTKNIYAGLRKFDN